MTVVSCVGIAVQDSVYGVDQLPSGGGKVHAHTKSVIGGGVAANAAATVSRLGGSARYVGAIGSDSVGEHLLAELVDVGVDVSHVVEIDTHSPTSAVIVDQSGERMIINHTPTDLFERAPADVSLAVSGSDSVLVDVRWPAGALSALEWASASNVPGVLDLDVGNREVDQLLALASHVIFSTDALLAHTDTSDIGNGLERARSMSSAWLAVTAGALGTYWLDGNEMKHQPSFPINVVDTTGAGDVFHGAFALKIAEDSQDVTTSLRYASAAAAIKCMTFGGRAGIPTDSDVKEFLEGWS